jgi:hypothetical protein
MASLGWAKPVPNVVRDLGGNHLESQHGAGSNPTQPKETMMRFYDRQHLFYAGIDLHARTMHLCVLDGAGAASEPTGKNRHERSLKEKAERAGELRVRTEAARDERDRQSRRTARAEEVRPQGSRCVWPRQSSRPRCLDWPPARPRRFHAVELEAGNHATRPPSCRTGPERRPPATARPRRFEWSAWGTQEFLGREAQGPQSSGRGERPGDFDPQELFGAAWWLTHTEKVAARQTSVRS